MKQFKKVLLLTIFFAGLSMTTKAEEITLFNSDGEAIAYIDRAATTASAPAGVIKADGTDLEKRTPAISTASGLDDGKFIIYFKDFSADEVVK